MSASPKQFNTAPERSLDQRMDALSRANEVRSRRAALKGELKKGAVGIREYRAVPTSDKPHVVAVRDDGLPDLRIYSGYTIGFTTGDEARRVGFGSDTIRASDDAGKIWLVSHPVHGDLDKRGPADQTKRRDPGKCTRCGIYELSVSGKCPSCDED